MIIVILSVIALVLLAVNGVLVFQFVRCLKQHQDEPLEVHTGYLIRRLNAILVNGFIVTAIQIAKLFLR